MVEDYPDAKSGMFNIGLLHTSLVGAEGHEPYAPCTVGDLKAKGYDYWALGHVHTREIVSENPFIIFPGNIQGRHIRETGEKGCMLVTVDEQKNAVIQFEPLDVFRWEQCIVNTDGSLDGESLLDRVCNQLIELADASGGRSLAVRVLLEGECHAHHKLLADPSRWINQIRGSAIDCARGTVWIEKVKFHTRDVRDLDKLLSTGGPIGEMIEFLRNVQDDDEQLRRFCDELSDLRKKLPDELSRGDDALNLDDPAWLNDVLTQVEPLLVGRLSLQEDVT